MCILKFLPHHLLSRIMGVLTRIRCKPLVQWAIKRFVCHYRVDLRQAKYSSISHYKNFNEFFTRQLKSGCRSIVTRQGAIASPVDGSVSELGFIKQSSILQAKGSQYNLLDLLGGDTKTEQLFQNGRFLTAYLAPRDYHRIHMPCDGTLKKMIHIPGRLFSVNQKSVFSVSQLFARNERVVCLFETKVGPMVLIFVGAMFVGSITTIWHGIVTPPTRKKITTYNYREDQITYYRGEEIANFNMGSTVIILFGKDAIMWNADLAPQNLLLMGEEIGQFL